MDARSADYISSIGANTGLKADFGSGLWNGGPIGIPYVVVPEGQPLVPISFDYDNESDPGPYPIPPNPPIEGGPDSHGDRHVLVVQQGQCKLYETWSTYPVGGGAWQAGSGALFSLSSNALRPAGWTSADAAGLPRPPRLDPAALARRVSPAMLSFMRESRRLANERLKRELRVRLRYPTVDHTLAEAFGSVVN